MSDPRDDDDPTSREFFESSRPYSPERPRESDVGFKALGLRIKRLGQWVWSKRMFEVR